MFRVFPIFVALGACTTPVPPTSTRPPEPKAVDPRTVSTELEVSIADFYDWSGGCAATPQRRLDITLDGVRVSSVVVPCEEGVRAPPLQVVGPPFVVPPGRHRIGVVDLDTGVRADRDIEFPVLIPTEGETSYVLGDKLPVEASETAIQINDPTWHTKRL